MADQSAVASSFGSVLHTPGNPAFPLLPLATDPEIGKTVDLGTAAELRTLLIEIPRYTQSAAKGEGFGSWFLDQIWVTPNPVEFGDISDQKSVDVTFFSTYLNNQTINSVELPVAGLDITDPTTSPLFPATLQSFSDLIYKFTAAQAGPQTFDAYGTVVTSGATFEVRYTGRRVLLLFAEPENGSIETLNFATDIMRSKDGTEQAFSLRLAPFSNIQYMVRLAAENDWKRTELEALIVGGAPLLPFGMQLWWEAQKITSAAIDSDTVVNVDTRYMQLRNADSIVFTTPARINVIGTIASFTSSTVTLEQPLGTALPLDTFAMPVRFGHLTADPQLATAAKNLQEFALSLRTEDDFDMSNVDAGYFDFHTVESPARPILRKRGMSGGQLRGLLYRKTQELDSVTGRLFVTGTESMGEWVSELTVYCNSKAEIWAWRAFLHHVRGSWGTFYLPTFQNDLPLWTAIPLGGNTFDVPYMGIANLLNGAAPYRDLRIDLEDGSTEYKRITSVVDNGNGTETVTVSSVIGSVGTSQPANTRISWMHLCRIDGDAAQFKHLYLGQAELNFVVRSVKE